MGSSEGCMSNEHQEQFKSALESADPSSVSPLQISTSSPTSPRSPRPQHGKHSSGSGSQLTNQRHTHFKRDGRPKKDGCGGKGTWGGLLDTGDDCVLKLNDTNYSSNEEDKNSIARKTNSAFEEYNRKAIIIVEEYFANDDAISTANELIELKMPSYHYHFVKKLVFVTMDRHDKENEMVAVLLSSLYGNVVDPLQVYKGFQKLLESTYDLIVDIPSAVDILALFISRAVVDDILPPSFLTNAMACLSKDSKGVDVTRRAKKGYLSCPLHVEAIERRWGGGKNKTIEDLKGKIINLLIEHVASGDVNEACICIKDLNVPHFHYEIVKRAVNSGYGEKERGELSSRLAEEDLIKSSQVSKGFGRIIDSVDDLSLDIPNAKVILRSLISKAASEGWLCASSLNPSRGMKPLKTARVLQDNKGSVDN